jgi:hypothetical protein
MKTRGSEPFQPAGLTRAEALARKSPQIIADVMLYATAERGKKLTVLPGWGCPCSLEKSNTTLFYDAWPLLSSPFAPGESRRLGFVFLGGDEISSEEIAAKFREAGRFYLWEARFIGEAVVVLEDSER